MNGSKIASAYTEGETKKATIRLLRYLLEKLYILHITVTKQRQRARIFNVGKSYVQSAQF